MKKTMKLLANLLILSTLLFSLTIGSFAADEEDDYTPDVDTVSAEPLNESAKITWDSVNDEEHEITGYEIHYGTQPVQEDGNVYESSVNVENVTSHIITGLTNDTKYYFSVVSIAKNGASSMHWSQPEAFATPSIEYAQDEDDSIAPTVTSTEAVYIDTVKVVFSESITLPESNAELAFFITNEIEELAVITAEYDTEDESNSTILLTTVNQIKDDEYTLTIGTDISDIAGNNIISGTSDTGIFTGIDTEKPEGDIKEPTATDAESTSSTTILINFDETVSLSIEPEKDFTITSLEDENIKLEISQVVLGNNEDGTEYASAIITTSEQDNITYSIAFANIKDLSGNVIDGQTRIFTGTKKAEEPDDNGETGIEEPGTQPKPDTTAPADIAKLIAKSTIALTKFDVNLSWTLPLETEDLVSQTIYMSTGVDQSFESKKTLDAEATNHTIEGLTPGEYYFKHTQTDLAGNESEGTITKITLSETGPGVIGLLLFSLGAGQLTRRKNKK